MSRYLFFEIQGSTGQANELEELLSDYSRGLSASVDHLLRALQLLNGIDFGDDLKYRLVIVMLARHVAEEIDAASILVSKGCVSSCKPHLRSAFEADLGIRYILATSSEQRALCYLVKHFHDQLRIANKVDPASDHGKELRRLISDPIGREVLDNVAASGIDFEKSRSKFENLLASPKYESVSNEWTESKKRSRGQPAWFSLFEGPKNIRDLAIHLNREFWYEFLYSDWSDQIHAGGSIKNISLDKDDESGETSVLRPIRDPQGIESIFNFGMVMCCATANDISRKFLSAIGQQDLTNQYRQEVRPLITKLKGREVKTNWR